MQYKQPQNGGYKPAFKSPGVLWSAANVDALWSGGTIGVDAASTIGALGNSVVGRNGKQLNCSSNAALYNIYQVFLPATSDYTLAWYGDASGAQSGTFVFPFGLVGTNLALMLRDNTGALWGVWNGTQLHASEQAPSGLSLYVVTRKNGVVSFYRDGVFKGSVSDATALGAITNVVVNKYQNTTGAYGLLAPGYHVYAFYETRGWSAGEVLALSRNPWSIFKPVNKVLKASSGTTNASLTTTDAQDIAALAATVTTGASVAAVDGKDVAALTALNWTVAGIAATDSGDIAALAATVTTGASLSTTDGFDIAAVTASIGSITSASIISADGADNASVHAANWTNSFLSTFDGADSLAILGRITTGAVITGTDGADNAVIASSIWTNSALSLLDGWDVATLTAQTGQTVAGISLQDWPDSAIINTSFHVNYILASITVNDYALNTLSMSNYAPWSINMSDFS